MSASFIGARKHLAPPLRQERHALSPFWQRGVGRGCNALAATYKASAPSCSLRKSSQTRSRMSRWASE